jgi:hypothetical protein
MVLERDDINQGQSLEPSGDLSDGLDFYYLAVLSAHLRALLMRMLPDYSNSI